MGLDMKDKKNICAQIAGRYQKAGKKDKGRLRGLSLTKGGTLPQDQIPVRVMFNWDGRKPGFFEFGRVAHCGADASGQFCQTLTGTNVGSGWTEEHALLNSAHRWVKERIEQMHNELPFPMKGVDSDNGGEFINHQLKDWCGLNNIQFTRGRPYRKNDNCLRTSGPSRAKKRRCGA